jgi:catechol 2,3-dioxygenase
MTIAAGTRMGTVELSVADLARSLDFYETAIGLAVLEREPGRAVLGAGTTPLLDLREEPGARPADGYAGLFHFALVVPGRADLAGWLAHAARDRVPLTGLSDHFVSEALYLRDPDHHGIEIDWDRPRDVWEGQVAERIGTWALDVDSLLGELPDPATAPFDGLPVGTTMGHVHFRAIDIADTVAFYRDVLGLGLMADLGPQAAFLSAGGYHHHVGANTWETVRAAPAPEGTARLRRTTLLLPDAAERDRVVARVADAGQDPVVVEDGVEIRDPSGATLLLDVAEGVPGATSGTLRA